MDLKELLGQELFDQVQIKLGDKKLIINDGSYIPIEKFNEKNNENKTLKAEIATRDTQLNELKGKAQGNDDLTRQIEELTALNTKTQSEYEAKIKDMTLNTHIEQALSKHNAKFTDLLINKIDKSKILINDNTVIGLDEQIEGLKTTYKDLFGQKVIGKEANVGGTGGEANKGHITGLDFKALGLSEADLNSIL